MVLTVVVVVLTVVVVVVFTVVVVVLTVVDVIFEMFVAAETEVAIVVAVVAVRRTNLDE